MLTWYKTAASSIGICLQNHDSQPDYLLSVPGLPFFISILFIRQHGCLFLLPAPKTGARPCARAQGCQPFHRIKYMTTTSATPPLARLRAGTPAPHRHHYSRTSLRLACHNTLARAPEAVPEITRLYLSSAPTRGTPPRRPRSAGCIRARVFMAHKCSK